MNRQPLQANVPHVPLLDIARENAELADRIQQALQEVCRSGQFVLGPHVARLEAKVAELTGAAHAIGCASGSDALLLALMALDIGAGDEVIVPSFTFFATASAVWRVGAMPVFVDIDPKTFNLCPEAVRQALTARTRAIIPVHLFGQPADMTAIAELASRHGLKIIEDAAQAIGARHTGRAVGTWGDVGCFSFYPTKNLGGFGDGGMITVNDSALADRLRMLRVHGMRQRYHHEAVGINSRLDSLQAAVLEVKLEKLPEWTELRQENAKRYASLFGRCERAAAQVELPVADERSLHVWNQFTIRVADGQRDALRQFLADNGVGTEVYYPVPLHRQECFKSLASFRRSLPETERAARQVLSLPIFPRLTADEQQTVVARIEEFFATRAPVASPTWAVSAPVASAMRN